MDTPIVTHDKRSIKPEAYHALAESRGMKWIGPYTGKVIDATVWECSKGHHFEMPYYILQRDGCGCTKCRRIQPEDYHVKAVALGHVWSGPQVATAAIKTGWRCSLGHEWSVSYNALRGCPECRNIRMRDEKNHKPEDYHTLASRCGLEWLGPEVGNARTATKWRCAHGHERTASYSVIRRSGGCYRCWRDKRSDENRIQPEQYHEMARRHGFVWLGPHPKRISHKTWWQCVNGHKWNTSYAVVESGAKCAECIGLVNGRRVSKPQVQLCEMVGGELNYKIGRCTVDVALFIGGAKIAIEYDCYYWHAKTQENDRRRAEYMIRRGWKALSVKTNTKLPSMRQLQDAFSILLAGESYREIVLDDWGKAGGVNEHRYNQTE